MKVKTISFLILFSSKKPNIQHMSQQINYFRDFLLLIIKNS